MAAGIAFGEADVTGPDGTVHKGVNINTRNNTLTVRNQNGDTLLELTGVSRVARITRKQWEIHLGPTVTYQVKRIDCGCS